jgi:hypothetical protein
VIPRIETFGDALVAFAWIPVITLAAGIAYYLVKAWRLR